MLNVVETPAERSETLRKAYTLALRTLVVAVRVDQSLDKGIPFQDGVITNRGAFQKIYTQSEFRQFIGDTLCIRPHVAGLGVAYAFKAREEEERYVANTAFPCAVALGKLSAVCQRIRVLPVRYGESGPREQSPTFDSGKNCPRISTSTSLRSLRFPQSCGSSSSLLARLSATSNATSLRSRTTDERSRSCATQTSIACHIQR